MIANKERRRGARTRCSIPASVPGARVLIEDLSPVGARLRALEAPQVGSAMALDLLDDEGRRTELRAVARRVRRGSRGFVIGCSLDGDGASTAQAWKLWNRVRRGSGCFVAPPVRRAPRAHTWSLGDYFGLRTVALLGAGVAALILASVILVGTLA